MVAAFIAPIETAHHDPRKFAALRDVNVALRPGSKLATLAEF